jgi:tripartite ATP-independent transporter DctM subunit
MILYGVMSGSSIVKLFVAGIVPGLLGGFGMMAISYYLALKHDWPIEERFNLCRVWVTFKETGWALIMPLIILGAIFGGIVTATEGAGLAVVAALLIGGLIYRDLDYPHFMRAAVDGAVQTAVVMLLIATSALLGIYLTEAQVPQRLAAEILEFTSNRYAVLAILNVFFLILGLFLHSAAAIILVVPIVMPLVNAVGIDPVHFGIIVTLNLSIGQQTPPVASVLIATCSIAKADIWEVTKVNVWFIGVLLFVLLLVTYVPFIPMALVDFFYD